ncbi:MAG TPA: N-formylglutamate amidohydrolase, partial [Sphingomonadaceae bacterium]|nr:N-formylglutamate amidohydrolase [Sphingomonadaceae bacterium]
MPHAGRLYPAALRARAAVPLATLAALEDRHADLLIAEAAAAGHIVFVARRARSWIDLNRDPREIDPALVEPPPRAHDIIVSAKVRGGLGLIPRRLNGSGELWRAPLSAAELARRIARDHGPWHDALAAALTAAQTRFGAALLLDCHSMPPVTTANGGAAPEIVIGDRYGRSASGVLVARLVAIAEAMGFAVACNTPYAGGYTLDRHGVPARGRHAIQIEIDRRLYLEPDLRAPGPGVVPIGAMLARMAAAMADELGAAAPLAAE